MHRQISSQLEHLRHSFSFRTSSSCVIYAPVLGLVNRRFSQSSAGRDVHPGLVQQMPQKSLLHVAKVGPADGCDWGVPHVCTGEDWREVSTLDLVPGDAPGLLLLVGASPAARAWARAAASAFGRPGGAVGMESGKVLDEASMEPGRVADGEGAVGLPASAGTGARGPRPQTLECSEGRAGVSQGAQAQTGSEASHCGRRPVRSHVVHVCGSAEAAAALLAAEGGARESQAGAKQPHIAVDSSVRWAALREVSSPQAYSISTGVFFQLGYCGVQRMRRS